MRGISAGRVEGECDMKSFVMLVVAFGLLDAVAVAQEPHKAGYIAKFTTEEKCYSCGYVNAVECFGNVPDCGVPIVAVEHFKEFETITELMAYFNAAPAPSSWIGYPNPEPGYPRKLVAIYQAKSIEFSTATKREEKPQAALVTEKTIYSVK